MVKLWSSRLEKKCDFSCSPDAIIAASAKIINTALVTKNLKHFPMEDIVKIRPY